MVTEVKMFKTSDGQTFDTKEEAEEVQAGITKSQRIAQLTLMLGLPHGYDTDLTVERAIQMSIRFAADKIVDEPLKILEALGYVQGKIRHTTERLELLDKQYHGQPRAGFNATELIDICEFAFVREEHWTNRDSAEAQKQLGQAYAWLRAGCHVQLLLPSKADGAENSCTCDEDTIWVEVYAKGFNFFENHDEDSELPKNADSRKYCKDSERFYLPTPGRLLRSIGKDWY